MCVSANQLVLCVPGLEAVAVKIVSTPGLTIRAQTTLLQQRRLSLPSCPTPQLDLIATRFAGALRGMSPTQFEARVLVRGEFHKALWRFYCRDVRPRRGVDGSVSGVAM